MQNLEPVAQKMVIALGTKEDILGAAAPPPPPADSRFYMKVLMDCPHKLLEFFGQGRQGVTQSFFELQSPDFA